MNTKLTYENGLTYEDCIRVVVAEARPIIEDGAADDLTTEDLRRAERTLAGSRESADIAALAEVVALGVEYLNAVQREETAVHQVGPDPTMAAAFVRHFYGKGLVP